jgi:hypothetical protein
MIDNQPQRRLGVVTVNGSQAREWAARGPGFIAFAGENGHAHHTYTVMAPDPFVAPYHSLLLKRTPGAPRLTPGGILESVHRARQAASYWFAGSTLKLLRVAEAPA